MAELSGNPSTSDVDLNSGPPAPAIPHRKSNNSLFNQAGNRLQNEAMNGFGPEGGSTEMMALQGMSLVQKGVQMLSAMYPGLTPLVSDLVGRLQMAVPALVTSTGSSGMVPMAGMPPQNPMAGPTVPPPPGGGQMPPPGPGGMGQQMGMPPMGQ
jgi:hypothetical protein